mmetsp:Transcript_57248/g.149943  ORF Transcript_57248/g.149943 Transcript_57248/m.149943 type:complete len:237 (-) Transcript_57248:44-754(-)
MGWGGESKGDTKGKGKSSGPKVQDPSKTIWVGNVPPNTQFRDLLEFAKQAGPAVWAEVMGKTAAIGYKSPQDAESAIGALNGADFMGSQIQTDVWTGKAAEPGGKSGGKSAGKIPGSCGGGGSGWNNQKGGGGGGGTWQPQFEKSWDNGKGKGKGKKKIQNPGKTVWIGQIPEGTEYPELLELAKSCGDAKWAEVWKGTGAVGFATEDEAQAAIAQLNGAALGNGSILADKWGTKD